MRLFICEFITGGGLQDKELPDSLVREGNMMLEAAIKDFLDLGTIDIVITRDARLDSLQLPVEQFVNNGDVYRMWKSCMYDADAVLIIAPESNNVLFELTQMAENTGCYVLGSASDAVKLASSKLQTEALLLKNKIACIETDSLKDKMILDNKNGWVVKPDDGAGAEDCYYCSDRVALDTLRDLINIENFVIQEYVQGISASLSMLCFEGEVQLLACNRQLFNFEQGKGQLKGIVVNGLLEQWEVFNVLAQNIARIDKDLRGYIGVDLIMSDKDLVVVEVNPRLTTSYVGLRQSLSINPAALILSIWQNESMPEINKKDFLPVNLLLEEPNAV